MISTERALATVVEFDGLQMEVTDELVAEFEEYLEKIELRECENCGWYGHPGEICDCADEDICDNCGYPEEDCVCDEDYEDEGDTE